MNKVVEYNGKKYELMGFIFDINFDKNVLENRVLEIRDIETDERIQITDEEIIKKLVDGGESK